MVYTIKNIFKIRIDEDMRCFLLTPNKEEELSSWYYQELKHVSCEEDVLSIVSDEILFTDEEIKSSIKGLLDYQKKERFLLYILPCLTPSLSWYELGTLHELQTLDTETIAKEKGFPYFCISLQRYFKSKEDALKIIDEIKDFERRFKKLLLTNDKVFNYALANAFFNHEAIYENYWKEAMKEDLDLQYENLDEHHKMIFEETRKEVINAYEW